jgi:hypothetical protein
MTRDAGFPEKRPELLQINNWKLVADIDICNLMVNELGKLFTENKK